MGVNLINEVLERAPKALLPYDRLVLMNLAEKANDQTRQVLPSRRDVGDCTSCDAQPGLCSGRAVEHDDRRTVATSGSCCGSCRHLGEQPRETLRRRTGLTDAALTKVFQRLAKVGLEVRVPIRTDSRGRPVYSHPGRGTNFLIPVMPGPQSTHKAGPESTQIGMVGPESTDGSTHVQPSEPEWVDPGPTPVRQSVNGSVSDAHASDLDRVPEEQRPAVLELLTRFGDQISESDAIDCVAWAAPKAKTNLPGYLSRFTAEEIRTNAEKHRSSRTSRPSALANRCAVPGHQGRAGLDDDGDPNCGECATERRQSVA